MSDKLTYLTIKVPESMKHEFKIKTTKNGETMTDVLKKTIEEYIK